MKTAEQQLTEIFNWIEKRHPDGFIDSLTHEQNLDRVYDRMYDRIDSAGVEAKKLKVSLKRLANAVANRMTPDDPTGEERLELLEAYKEAEAYFKVGEQP